GTGMYTLSETESIPDDDTRGVTQTLAVQQYGTVRKLTIRVRLSHEALRQVFIALVAPNGRRAILKRPNPDEDSYTTVFYVRELIGVSAHGTWTLQVKDLAPGVTGRLLSWELYVTS